MSMLRAFACIFLASVLAACGPSEPKTAGAPAGFRQLSEAQYRNIVADVFGPDIQIAGAFAPIPRTDGLMAVGAGRVAITPSAFERHEKLARFVATQVVAPDNRAVLVPCAPAKGAVDEACARTFFTKTGRLLYRRPLSDTERDDLVALTANVAKGATFYDGLAAGLSAMLVAPDFLLIGDVSEPDPDKAGALRLTDYSKASRLSFFLWNAGPDDALLTAAEKGELSRAGLSRQVERMLQSPRVEAGVRALFTDMLMLEGASTLQKDPVIYPAFSMASAVDASEQTLRTVVDHLLTRDGDYRDLFTTRHTFMSRTLGVLYQVPVQRIQGWVPYEFPENDPHVGIQSHVSLLALASHPGRSSVTLRGKAVRELLLCQKVPDPPADVDFALVAEDHPLYKTARERVAAHSANASCSGCHKLMDPIGLSLENFDGAGQFRDTENGVAIDPSGELDGVPFQDPIQLGKALHGNASATQCVVNRAFAYAAGRAAARDERALIEYLEKRFADDGYRLKTLLKDIATSDGLYAVGPAAQSPASQAATDVAKERS